MTRRPAAEPGFLFMFQRWRPIAGGPENVALRCIGCEHIAGDTWSAMRRAGWHGNDDLMHRRFLCPACTEENR